ncbi:unnamed protein product [Soboliphyme baturini]|uniref:Ovule protein n=1 Tax=Soboliphyme baturini TaxID=241478 RepID=A0A183I912_9BILA|nr:unnamed protein product [Soboliphyme baturini]
MSLSFAMLSSDEMRSVSDSYCCLISQSHVISCVQRFTASLYLCNSQIVVGIRVLFYQRCYLL